MDSPRREHPSLAELIDEPATDVRVLQSELLTSGHVWDVRRDRFEFGALADSGADNNAQDRVVVLERDYMDHPGAVAVVALDDEERLLMFRQYRHPIAHRDWEIPAGLMDVPGESGLESAQRELAEEADIQADDWALLLDLFLSPGGSSEVARVFLARDITEIVHDYVREGEETELVPVWVPLDDAVAAVLSGQIANGLTVSAVLALAASRAQGWTTLRDPHSEWTARNIVRGERTK